MSDETPTPEGMIEIINVNYPSLGSDIDQPRPSCSLLFDSDNVDKSLLIPINFEGPRHSEGFSIITNGEEKSSEEGENNLSLRLAVIKYSRFPPKGFISKLQLS